MAILLKLGKRRESLVCLLVVGELQGRQELVTRTGRTMVLPVFVATVAGSAEDEQNGNADDVAAEAPPHVPGVVGA